ncbi:MAG: hypothetical protein KQH79_13975 [Bacteroidetes bacterium]|nr:hypothetical protein [Bacteroidota bacterium]
MSRNKHIVWTFIFSIVTAVLLIHNTCHSFTMESIRIEINCSANETHESNENTVEDQLFCDHVVSVLKPLQLIHSMHVNYTYVLIPQYDFSIWTPPKIS